MSSDYKRYWTTILQEAQKKGLNQTEFAARCDMPKQSMTKYQRGQGITAKTMVIFMEALNLDSSALELRSGMVLTPQEHSELKGAKWMRKYKREILYLQRHPEMMDEIQRKAREEV